MVDFKAVVSAEIKKMPSPIVVYIYGQPGCGKTRLLNDVFSTSYGIVYKGTVRISVWDDAGYHSFANLDNLPQCDYLVISSNMQPDDLPIHMDHVFCLDSANALDECRSFLNSIYGVETERA
jgi:hypothetical protein